jgi:hypothetical protein
VSFLQARGSKGDDRCAEEQQLVEEEHDHVEAEQADGLRSLNALIG